MVAPQRLDHFAVSGYPGDEAAGWRLRAAGLRAHLPGGTSATTSTRRPAAAADRLAEYLYLNIASPRAGSSTRRVGESSTAARTRRRLADLRHYPVRSHHNEITSSRPGGSARRRSAGWEERLLHLQPVKNTWQPSFPNCGGWRTPADARRRRKTRPAIAHGRECRTCSIRKASTPHYFDLHRQLGTTPPVLPPPVKQAREPRQRAAAGFLAHGALHHAAAAAG